MLRNVNCPKHTESLDFAPLKLRRAWCIYSNIFAQVPTQGVMFPERRVKSLVVCMPYMDKQCAYFHAKDLSLNAEQQRLRCAWALRAATDESQKTLNKCETRNKTVFDTRLRHPETINSVPLNSVLRIKQTCV